MGGGRDRGRNEGRESTPPDGPRGCKTRYHISKEGMSEKHYNFVCLFLSETSFHYVIQAGLELPEEL